VAKEKSTQNHVTRIDSIAKQSSIAVNKPKFDVVQSLTTRLEHAIRKSGASLSHTSAQVDPLRRRMMAHFQKLLLSDLECARRENALQIIWQKCFYPFITAYRDELQRSPSANGSKKQLSLIISD